MSDPVHCYGCRRAYSDRLILRAQGVVEGWSVRLCPLCLGMALRRPMAEESLRQSLLEAFAEKVLASMDPLAKEPLAGDLLANCYATRMMQIPETRTAIVRLASKKT